MKSIKTAWVLATCLAGAPSLTLAQEASSVATVTVNIERQPMESALNSFATQTGLQLLFRVEEISPGLTAQRVVGTLTPQDALKQMLEESGLRFEFINARTVAIRTVGRTEGEPKPTADAESRADRMRLAQAGVARSEAPSASQPTNASADGLEEIVITSSNIPVTIGKAELSLREVPQSVSVITRQRIEEQKLTTLTEALQSATGMTVQRFGTGRYNFTARGFPLDVIHIDSVAVDRSDQNVILSPDLAIYDRIEILRGANGLFQGSGNPSGSVNLIRKRPTDQFAASTMLEAGSWQDYRADVDVGGPLNSSATFRARGVASYQQNDFFYDVAHQKKWLAYGIAEYDLARNTHVAAGFSYNALDALPTAAGLPSYADGSDTHLPRSTFLGTIWNRFDQKNYNGFVELTQGFANGWSAKLVGGYAGGRNDWKGADAFGPVDPVTGLGSPLSFGAIELPDYRSRQYGLDLFASGPFELFGRTHKLLLGGNIRHHIYAFTRMRFLPEPALGLPADVFNWDPAAVPEPVAASQPFFEFNRDRKESGFYANSRFSLSDKLMLSLGARVSRWEVEQWYGSQGLFVGAPSGESDTGVVTPYGGVVYDLNQTFSIYASYADIFQPQTEVKFPSGLIDPIVGSNVEAGVKGEFFNKGLIASLALFQIDQKNRAQPDPNQPCLPGTTCYSIAQGKVVSKGIELELSGRVGRRVDLGAGYTYMKTEYAQDRDESGAPTSNEGQPFSTYSPKHQLKVWSSYYLPEPLSKWSLGTGLRAQTKTYIEGGPFGGGSAHVEQGGYWLADLRLGYQLGTKTSLALNVNNLFDETYYSGLTILGRAYGEPRNLTLTLRMAY